ncbi:MAG TPA: oligoendopeptidase, partial [Symbiobacteriaceae bacterium]|nr:oligoendopeptidase [Symbiobacteriaceae bacterium]
MRQTWDLEVIFPGGSQSEQLARFIDNLEADIAAFRRDVEKGGVPGSLSEARSWMSLLDIVQDLGGRMR